MDRKGIETCGYFGDPRDELPEPETFCYGCGTWYTYDPRDEAYDLCDACRSALSISEGES